MMSPVPPIDSLSSGDARLDRIDVWTGASHRFGNEVVSLFSGALWSGIRLNQGRRGPTERTEGFLSRHYVSMTIEESVDIDLWWPGKRVTNHRLTPGHLSVIPAHMPWVSRTRAIRTLSLDITPDFVAGVAEHEMDRTDLEIRPVFDADEPRLAHLMAALAAEARAGGPNGRLYGEGVGTAIVAHLLRGERAAVPAAATRVRALPAGALRRVKRYIEEHLETELSLQTLAGTLGLNVYRFVRAFRQSTGLPPHRYVLQQRIARSKALLVNPRLSITEVALRSGFASQSHFTTAFRRLTGATPARYRTERSTIVEP